jgi:hypothetical protein
MLRSVIFAASRSSRIERLVASAPVSRDLVGRFVAGTTTEDEFFDRTVPEAIGRKTRVTLDPPFLGGDRLEIEALVKIYRHIARRVLENICMAGKPFGGQQGRFQAHAPGVAAVCGLGHGARVGRDPTRA